MIDFNGFIEHVAGFSQKGLSDRDLKANFALGLPGETGEAVDVVKKHLYHGDPLDRPQLVKELGDSLWYLVALCLVFDISPYEVMEINVQKLRERHGGATFDREKQRDSKAKEKA